MARRKKVAFEISARDKQATASLRRLSARFNQMMRPLDRLNRKLRANQRALKPVLTRLNRFAYQMEKVGQKAGVGLTLPIAAVGAITAKTAASFETGMIKVKALTRSNYIQFAQLKSMAKDLGSTTQFSAREAADGMSYLGMAGFKSREIMSAIPGVMDLAAASQLELGETADYASNILTGFGKKAAAMGDISDKLTYAFTNSNTTLTELHNGLAKAGGVAVKAGVSFEDVTASMMALADAGHKGETAGVAMAGALARVSKFSMDGFTSGRGNEVSKTLASLGIGLDEFLYRDGPNKGKFKIKFQEFIKLLDEHKAALPDYQKIFGQDAGKYIVGLSGQFQKMNKYLDGLQNKSKGLTRTIAGEYMSGAEGGFKLLVSALEGLFIALGDTGFLDVVNAVLRSLANFVQDMSSASKPVLRFVVISGLLAATLGPVAIGIGLVAKGFTMLLPFVGLIKTIALSFALLGIKVLAITAVIGVVIYAVWFLWKNWDKVVKKMSEKWDHFTRGLKHLAVGAGWALRKSFAEATNDVIDNLNRFFKETSLGKWLAEKFGMEGNISHIAVPDKPWQLEKTEDRSRYEVSGNLLEAFSPRLSPLVPVFWEPFEAREEEWKILPDAISKGFASVYEKQVPTIKVLTGYQPEGESITLSEFNDRATETGSFDFGSFKREVSEKTLTEKQQLDVNVNIAGATKETRVETRNRSAARVSVDTGRVMVGT